MFDPFLHESGDKIVLGRTIPAGGVDEGEAVLRMLARHPSTARFVSTKLVRRFVTDDPPERLVAEAAATFLQTDGDIAAVLQTIFESPNSSRPRITAQRSRSRWRSSLAACAPPARPSTRNKTTDSTASCRRWASRYTDAKLPDGYPDYAAAWLNTNALLSGCASPSISRLANSAAWTWTCRRAAKCWGKMGLSMPDADEMAESQRLAALAPEYEDAAANNEEGAEMMDSQGMAADDGAMPEKDGPTYTPDQLAVATMLASPEFQKR